MGLSMTEPYYSQRKRDAVSELLGTKFMLCLDVSIRKYKYLSFETIKAEY